MSRERDRISIQATPFLAQLCDSAGVALLAVDRQLQVFYVNRSAVELLACAQDCSDGVPLREVIQADAGDLIEDLTRRTIEEGECAACEFSLAKPNRGELLFAATFSPIRDAEGVVAGASICLRDITRYARLQRQQSQASKMQALGHLAGSLAHHFNNILGGVVTRVDFVQNSSDVRVLKKTLQAAAGSLQRATGLLDELLAFAEGDHKDTDLADLTETVLHFADHIEPDLDRRGIEFDLQIVPLPIVAVPHKHLTTVLEKIAANALEAMAGSGCFSIQLEPRTDHVVCRVLDTGTGILSAHLEHVFEPFYSTKGPRGSADRARHPGLGLSVALGMVHEMGGDMTITSTPGSATIVEIHLPIDPRKPVWTAEPAGGAENTPSCGVLGHLDPQKPAARLSGQSQ